MAKAAMALKAPLMLLLLTFIRAHLCVPSVHTCFKLVEVIRALVWCLFPICLGVYLLMVKEDKEPCSR